MDTRTGRQDPTVSVILPYKSTKGQEAIDIYNQTGRTALEWQQLLEYDIMAVDAEGLWVHQKFGYSLPRRNGKSEIILARVLWGLNNGEKILYTAHRTTTTHSIWERLCKMCEDLNMQASTIRAIGREHIHCETGAVEFRTRTSAGGLGEGYDLLIIDEAQEYTPMIKKVV